MLKAAQAYFQTQVTTTSQGQLLIMLYDGAIKYLTQAKERIAARDVAGKGILISRALDVLNELDGSLNLEKGGELADNLHKLYFFCSTRLLTANLKQDVVLIDDVIHILEGLREAYAQILDTPEAQAAAAQIAAGQSANAKMPVRTPIAMAAQPAQGKAQFGRMQAQAYGRQQAEPAASRPQTQQTVEAEEEIQEQEQVKATPSMPPQGFAPNSTGVAAMYRRASQR